MHEAKAEARPTRPWFLCGSGQFRKRSTPRQQPANPNRLGDLGAIEFYTEVILRDGFEGGM